MPAHPDSPSRLRAGALAVVFLTGLALSACSGGGGTPAAPSSSDQLVAGAWTSNATLASVSGGECVGATLQAAVGSRDLISTAILQTGSSLGATVTSEGNGTSCAFTGTVLGGSVNLRMTSCQAGRVAGIQCGNGAVRDLQLVSGGVEATVNNGTGTGTDTSTWNVTPSGSATSVGTLTLRVTFAWIQLGLPSSDFHNFTGTVEPGYQDGVITIGPPEPFCVTCGWFH